FFGWDVFRSAPYQPNIYSYGTFWRAKGFFSNPITFANSFGVLAFFVFGLFISQIGNLSKKQLWTIVAGFSVFLLAIVFSLTRGIWLSVFFILLILPLFINDKTIRKGMYGVMFLFLITVSAQPSLREHFKSSFTITESSAGKRMRLWNINYEMFKDNPLLGVGLHQNPKHTLKYYIEIYKKRDMESHAHNLFLQVLAGTGIFGFLFFMWFMSRNYLVAVTQYTRAGPLRGIALGYIMALSCITIGGLTEVNFFDGEVTHMFMAITAVFYGVINSKDFNEKLIL
ncbi:MAG: O-antigen ligase family protein, partial [Bdellovibrionales bacterium]|nr:O-antigen ligase family protein [Bdellovibrionales bacterium]